MLENNTQELDRILLSKDPFDILGLKRGSSLDAAKKSFKKLAKIYHPDINPGNEKKAETVFVKISKAFSDVVALHNHDNKDSSLIPRKKNTPAYFYQNPSVLNTDPFAKHPSSNKSLSKKELSLKINELVSAFQFREMAERVINNQKVGDMPEFKEKVISVVKGLILVSSTYGDLQLLSREKFPGIPNISLMPEFIQKKENWMKALNLKK